MSSAKRLVRSILVVGLPVAALAGLVGLLSALLTPMPR